MPSRVLNILQDPLWPPFFGDTGDSGSSPVSADVTTASHCLAAGKFGVNISPMPVISATVSMASAPEKCDLELFSAAFQS
ncbi:hypothetical protein Hamer_G002800 [Homarus americanus]|uniref:Uncharacterized protein n=1 Tax=Homarus americanus TaxID=6706 RepID=A0A8J5JT04_HOMAM|nr:hypothetical protein Hamer_G002800 [Homarus americanus]